MDFCKSTQVRNRHAPLKELLVFIVRCFLHLSLERNDSKTPRLLNVPTRRNPVACPNGGMPNLSVCNVSVQLPAVSSELYMARHGRNEIRRRTLPRVAPSNSFGGVLAPQCSQLRPKTPPNEFEGATRGQWWNHSRRPMAERLPCSNGKGRQARRPAGCITASKPVECSKCRTGNTPYQK